VTGFDNTQWQGSGFSPPLDFYTNELTINLCVYHCQWFPGLLFLGFVSQACLMCLSVWVVFKWQWCDWTSNHPAGNRHMTWPSNWLFVISRAQMGDHLAVFNFYTWKTLPLHGSPPLPNLHPYVITCDSAWCKNYLKWWAIQLAVLCRVGQLKGIV